MVDVSGAVDAEAGSRLRMYPVADLHPHPRSVKQHPERQLRMLAEEIKRDGFNAPVAVWREFVIAGEGRLLAAKRAELTEIPGIDCNHLDEDGVRRFMLADNRLGELGEWDADGLRAELASLAEFDGMDLDAIGFGLDDLDAILPPLEPEPAPPSPPEPKRETSSKPASPKAPAVKSEPTVLASTDPEAPPAQSGEASAAEAPASTVTQPEPSKPSAAELICSPGETWRIGEGLELTLEAFASPADLHAADMMIRKSLELFDLKSRRKSDGASVSKVLEDRNTTQPDAAGEGASAES